jgi:hypothetical protein
MSRVMRRIAATGGVAAICALALAGTAGAQGSLPTMTVALNGVSGITVSGTPTVGAMNIVSTFTGTLPKNSMGATFGIVRLDPGVTLQQAFAAVQAQHQDLNALDGLGALIVDANAPGTVQAVLSPGFTYVALNISGNGTPGFAPFTVAPSASPAALPAASATQTAIDFGFRGPSVLHNGTIVRAQNSGFLVHMIVLVGVKNAAAGRRVMALLRAGKDNQAQKLATSAFVNLMGGNSPGAEQQMVLNTKPGFYVEVCFMNTQDGREHTRLGMERLVRVVK